MKKINFNIQLFADQDNLSFNKADQEHFLTEISGALSNLKSAVTACGGDIKKLTQRCSGPVFMDAGNPMVEAFNKLSDDAANYVSSLGKWVASTAADFNSRVGGSFSGGFSGDASVDHATKFETLDFEGIKEASTASNAVNSLSETNIKNIEKAIEKIRHAAESYRTDTPPFPPAVMEGLKGVLADQEGVARTSYRKFDEGFNGFYKAVKSDLDDAVASHVGNIAAQTK